MPGWRRGIGRRHQDILFIKAGRRTAECNQTLGLKAPDLREPRIAHAHTRSRAADPAAGLDDAVLSHLKRGHPRDIGRAWLSVRRTLARQAAKKRAGQEESGE